MVFMGQREPAMMPVRREERSNMPNIGWCKFGDKHGRHTVEGRAFFFLDRSQHQQRIEIFDQHHGYPVGKRGTYGQHASETVEQRHADTEFILGGVVHAVADGQPVVHDVVMGQHHAFGKTGGT